MGIIQKVSCTVNGVLFQVDEAMIAAFDERELKRGFTRTQIAIKNVEFIKKNVKIRLEDKRDIVEAYELTLLSEQEAETMDVQSEAYKNLRVNNQLYIDVCLKGCMEYGEAFVEEFIRTMYDWRWKWQLERGTGSSRKAWDLSEQECAYVDSMLTMYVKKYHSFVPFHLQD